MNGYETTPWDVDYEDDNWEDKLDNTVFQRLDIPDEFIQLCEMWHGGQDSMFYAISSTGKLSLGSINPGGSKPLSNKDWMLSLISGLRTEISYCICKIRGMRVDRMGPDGFDLDDTDYYGFLDFMGFIVEKQGQIEATPCVA